MRLKIQLGLALGVGLILAGSSCGSGWQGLIS